MKRIVIGLTGPTGAGKSSLWQTAEKFGFKIVDCDRLARVAVEKGRAGHAALILAFGSEILNRDGTLNRRALAEIAFSSKENTELLNRTLLPHIAQLVREEADAERVLLDAPTLYESGIDGMCNATVAVLADEKIRLARIMKRDGIDETAARLRISAGKSDEFYKDRTPHIIYNNGVESDFKAEFKAIINKMLKENYDG